MALINCPECNKQVSDKAVACPNCAYPITLPSSSPPASTSTSQRDNLRNCPDCVNGEVKLSCKYCGGTGTDVCGLCKGSGFSYTSGEREICYSCHGRNSRFPCIMCAGNGYELFSCQTCDGCGQLTFEDYDAVLEQRKQTERERKEVQEKADEESERKRKEEEQTKKKKDDEEKRKWEEGAPLRVAEEIKKQEEAKRQSEVIELQRQIAQEERKQLEQKVKQSKIISHFLNVVMGAIIVVIYSNTSKDVFFPVIFGWSLGILIPTGLGYVMEMWKDDLPHTDKDNASHHSSVNSQPVPCYIPARTRDYLILGTISGALTCGILYSYGSYVTGSRIGILQAIFEAIGGLIGGVLIGLIVGAVVGLFIGLIKQTLKVGGMTHKKN